VKFLHPNFPDNLLIFSDPFADETFEAMQVLGVQVEAGADFMKQFWRAWID
jgi:hypothetical protein